MVMHRPYIQIIILLLLFFFFLDDKNVVSINSRPETLFTSKKRKQFIISISSSILWSKSLLKVTIVTLYYRNFVVL